MIQEYNVFNVAYLIFRLGPIILVSYFLLQSIFNLDPRGFVYLVGLVLTAITSSIAGQFLSFGMGDFQPGQDFRCNTMYLGVIPIDGTSVEPFSKVPLTLLAYSYTFAYLFTSFVAPPITYTNAMITLQQNASSLIMIAVLAILEAFWLISHACNSPIFISIAIVLGVLCGVFWTYIVRWTKEPRFQYMSLSNVEVCSKPSKTIYRCRNMNGSYKTTM